MTEVQGLCEARFKGVRETFQQNFDARGELGAAVAVSVDGEPVVDLWGGWADAARTRRWERDTLANVWSTTKGVTALLAHLLVEDGRLDLDAPVARYWPEFAAAGKEELPVRYLLSHRAGLAGLREPTTVADLYDWELTVSRLAATEPWWEPGSRSGYHALTYGFLVGEVIRRVTGRTTGAYLRERVTGPLGIDFTIGLPESEGSRVAELLPPRATAGSEQSAVFAQLHPAAIAALSNPVVGAADANTAPWRRAELPALNGHGTARAVAALYGLLAGERGVFGRDAVDRIREGQGPCLDLVVGAGMGRETEIALGCWLSGPRGSYGPNPRAFGHDGYGGSFGLGDPEAGVSIGYVMNAMGPNIADDPRKMALIDAVYAAL
ncbi:serine hydrolase domain-containing protein [Streptomyces sp. 8N706]|uniref:serine hydrolase domain-containing protein n=1 Tax=Streptomyces sp. 8N706 TaxID=3457416 RepID=UPI003FD32B23